MNYRPYNDVQRKLGTKTVGKRAKKDNHLSTIVNLPSSNRKSHSVRLQDDDDDKCKDVDICCSAAYTSHLTSALQSRQWQLIGIN